jgi:Raf kinase inhibitor-like YbhB/YbcL family protein
MKIKSPAFEKNAVIPREFTCDGPDKSPPLSWTDVPRGTKSFALVVEDPDAPGGAFLHWLLYDIPESRDHLDPDLPRSGNLVNGAKQGLNDFRTIGYGGPCPPRRDPPLSLQTVRPGQSPGSGRGYDQVEIV